VIRGHIVDAANGAGVPAASVAAVRGPEDVIDVAQATTSEDGSFALGGLDAKRYYLRPSKFGWRSTPNRASATAPAARVTVKLARVNVIRGVVKRTDGEPVPGAWVAAVGSGVAGTTITWRTNADGRFAQADFAPGTYYVWARHGDMLVLPPEKVDLGQGQEVQVALTLKHKGARVSGLVRSRDGQRLAPDTRVELQSRSPLGYPRQTAVGRVDGDGRFVVTGVLPGRYELSVRDGARTLSIGPGPREVEVPIEPNSSVPLEDTLVVRPQTGE
jgi:hypothetical protein